MVKRTALIIGIVITVIVIALIAFLIWFFVKKEKDKDKTKKPSNGGNGSDDKSKAIPDDGVLRSGMGIKLNNGVVYMGACGKATEGTGASASGASGGSNVGFIDLGTTSSTYNKLWTVTGGDRGTAIKYGTPISLSVDGTYLTSTRTASNTSTCNTVRKINTSPSSSNTVKLTGGTGNVMINDKVTIQMNSGKFVTLCGGTVMTSANCTKDKWFEAVENTRGVDLKVIKG